MAKRSPKRSHSKLLERRQVRRWHLAAVAIVMGAIGSYVVFSGHAAAPLSVQPGMNSDLTWGSGTADIAQSVNLMRQAGVKWTRVTCSWNQIEPRPGTYDWSSCEAGIGAAHSAGINVLVDVVQAPAWAQSGYANKDWPPTAGHYAQYGAFVGALARHFAPDGVKTYEIWSEENSGGFWHNSASAAEYTRLLQTAYRAVKAADPTNQVVFGGTYQNDSDYLTAAYQAGAKGYFDIMATHPLVAATPESGLPADNSSFLSYRQVHQVMADHGDAAKPLWLTEVGWSTCTTNPLCVPEATQADYLTRAYHLVEQDASYVPVVFWYGLRDNYWAHGQDDWQDRLGLLHSDYSPKPAYTAYVKLFGESSNQPAGQ